MRGIGFRDPASPIMEGIIDLHNYIFFFLIMIFVFVFVIFINILIDFGYQFNKTTNLTLKDLEFRYDLFKANKLTHNTRLELI
jgi:heme/copper-type cytochrome/quinol oxidase subunit 2